MHTYIVVANSARARVFARQHAYSVVEELEGFTHSEARMRNQDLTSDSAGKSRNIHGSLDAATSPKDHEADFFARLLVYHLKDLHNKQHYERLVLVAPPRFLGMLRRHLVSPLDHLVVGSIDKDLTTAPIADIVGHLEF